MRHMTQTERSRAFLADPHPLWLDAIEGVALGEDVEVIGKSTTVAAATDFVVRNDLDLVVVGIGRTGEFTVEFVQYVHGRCPRAKIVAVSADAGVDLVEAAFAAGANAFVLKTAEPEDLAVAIRQTFSASIFFNRGGGTATSA